MPGSSRATAQWLVEDLGSTNGTYLDRRKVDRPDAGAARRADPHRQDRHRAAADDASTSRYAARSRRRPAPRGQRGLGLRRAAPARRRRRHGRARRRRGRQLRRRSPPSPRSTTTRPAATCSTRSRRRVEPPTTHLRDMVDGDPALEGMGTTLTALLWPAAGSAWCTSATPAPTCCATASSPDHPRPHARADARRRGPHHRRRRPSTHPQRSLHHARARRPRRRRARPLDPRGPRRRPLPALLRRPVRRRVAAETLARGARRCPTPQEAVDRLVQLALRGGGPDNITVIVADVVETDHPPPALARGRRSRRRGAAVSPYSLVCLDANASCAPAFGR